MKDSNYLVSIFFITVFNFSFALYSREMGDFVKDIPIQDFQIELPKIDRFTKGNIHMHRLIQKEVPMVYGEWHISFGRRDLPESSLELSRLLEETWEFSGTKLFPKQKFLEQIESEGATLNLSIEADKTILSFSYLKSKEEILYPLILAFWNEPLLDSEVMETMKKKIKEEIKRRNDNPNSIASRKSRELLFKGTYLGKSLDEKKLDRWTLESLQNALKLLQKAEKRTLLLSGDVESSVWNDTYANWSGEGESKNSEAALGPSLIEKNLVSIGGSGIQVTKESSQSVIFLLGALPEHKHPDYYALKVLNYILGGGGFNSFFMREIRNNRGLAYSAGSTSEFQETYGVIQFYAMTKNESVNEVRKLMEEMSAPEFVAKIQESELERAKKAIQNQFVFLFTDARRILQNDLKFQEHQLGSDYLTKYRERINQVKLADLQRVAKIYLSKGKLKCLIVGPRTNMNDLKTLAPEDMIP